MMNKKEKEQLELNNLLKECVDEQKAIRLKPADDIEIFLGKDPISGTLCPRDAYGYVLNLEKRNVILIKRKCFEFYDKKTLKELIHHELIHLNKDENNKLITHLENWELFTQLSKQIENKYNLNPMCSYDIDCFKNNEHKLIYNGYSLCEKCGDKSFYLIDYNLNYAFDGVCPNCGNKLTYKKRLAK